MAKRDPNKTARNRIIEKYKEQLRAILDKVLDEVGLDSEAQLNAKLGSKNDDFFDLKHDVIRSPEEFVSKWAHGLRKSVSTGLEPSHLWIYDNMKEHKMFRKYVHIFVRRSFLKHYDELSKNRPATDEAKIWLGQENANYGLLVTPRFVDGQWENDKSEIRSFNKQYWSIGHVLKTGFVIPGVNRKKTFSSIEEYLDFFRDVIVRGSGSKYEREIAELYAGHVLSSDKPELIPLLVPEFRYAGLDKKHKYRLDFMVINPFTGEKIGFELSPWSTHGKITGTKGKTQAEINRIALANFSKEMQKHRDYFRKYHVVTLIFTDELLSDTKKLFKSEIEPHLEPQNPPAQLSFLDMEDLLDVG